MDQNHRAIEFQTWGPLVQMFDVEMWRVLAQEGVWFPQTVPRSAARSAVMVAVAVDLGFPYKHGLKKAHYSSILVWEKPGMRIKAWCPVVVMATFAWTLILQ